MAEERARVALARAAAHLALRRAAPLPSLVLMTDDERLFQPLAAVRALPRGSMVVVRARQSSHRARLAKEVIAIARMRDLFVLIANDAPLAAQLGADGIHLAEVHARTASHWRALHPRWLITIASHGTAHAPVSADAVFLSPVFATRSHPHRSCLGPIRASFIARNTNKPVYALGGIDSSNARRLSHTFAGIASISALAV